MSDSPKEPRFMDLDGPTFGPLDEIQESGAAVGCQISSHVLSPDGTADSAAPFALFVHLPPNFVVPRHAHAIPRMEVIIRGSIDVGGEVLGPGCVMLAAADTFYGPFHVGPGGALTAEFCANVKDSLYGGRGVSPECLCFGEVPRCAPGVVLVRRGSCTDPSLEAPKPPPGSLQTSRTPIIWIGAVTDSGAVQPASSGAP